MIPFLALVRKDLKLFFNDRKAVVVGLLAPILLASFFGYLFGGQRGNAETSKVPVLVIDQMAVTSHAGWSLSSPAINTWT